LSQPRPRPSGARVKVVPMAGIDPQLLTAVREGTYVVDPRAVAEAMIGREARRREVERLAAMLEARERDGIAGCGPEHDAGPCADVA
jgi:hypothetical protein